MGRVEVGGARVSGRSQPVLDIVSNIRLEGGLGLGQQWRKCVRSSWKGKQCVGGS